MRPMTTPRITRRTFLAGAGALALGAACSKGGLKSAPTGDSGDPTGRLRVLNWSQYIDVTDVGEIGTVDRFSQETGTSVDYSEDYSDNQFGLTEVFGPTLFEGKPTGYDIVVPTYWVVSQLLERGLLNEIPLEHVPNHVNIDPALLGTAWDRGARFHMPWQAGITGIAYNPALTGRDLGAFADLLDTGLKGRVGMVSEMREVVGLFMLARGDDPGRATLASADAALDRLEDVVASGQVARFTGNEYVDALESGEFAACLAWSGDVVQLQARRPDIRFVIPAEGGMRWFDSMVIPKGADNVASAGEFMNFVYDPANAARITAFVQFVTPVLGVREELERAGGDSAALAANPVLFPDEATRRRLSFWAGTTSAEEEALQTRFSAITGT
ncbi:MAG: spermidine/putrescine transport system substrate-binding protein [Actinomycetota bacterium]|nr:spermidine/putrescine transport system substrate-binding protein [Actinomycetota bacterium]